MESETTQDIIGDHDAGGCARCGALIAERGQARHDAWHEFVESSITGLTADLVALGPPTG